MCINLHSDAQTCNCTDKRKNTFLTRGRLQIMPVYSIFPQHEIILNSLSLKLFIQQHKYHKSAH